MYVMYALPSSSNCRPNLSFIMKKKSGQTEICNYWIQLLIQQNVACFNIPMNNPQLRILVQVEKPSCYTKYNAATLLPIKLPASIWNWIDHAGK